MFCHEGQTFGINVVQMRVHRAARMVDSEYLCINLAAYEDITHEIMRLAQCNIWTHILAFNKFGESAKAGDAGPLNAPAHGILVSFSAIEIVHRYINIQC